MVIENPGYRALPLCSAPFPAIQTFFSMTDAPDTPDTIQEPRSMGFRPWHAQGLLNEKNHPGPLPDTPDTIQEPRCWSDGRWTAQVIKNEGDDGWAVSMTLKGESDPAPIAPAA